MAKNFSNIFLKIGPRGKLKIFKELGGSVRTRVFCFTHLKGEGDEPENRFY
jgi:hypothetical protein